MNKIETVHIYQSSVNQLNGVNVGPGFAVIIDPVPTTKADISKVAQVITNALEGLVLDGE